MLSGRCRDSEQRRRNSYSLLVKQGTRGRRAACSSQQAGGAAGIKLHSDNGRQRWRLTEARKQAQAERATYILAFALESFDSSHPRPLSLFFQAANDAQTTCPAPATLVPPQSLGAAEVSTHVRQSLSYPPRLLLFGAEMTPPCPHFKLTAHYLPRCTLTSNEGCAEGTRRRT